MMEASKESVAKMVSGENELTEAEVVALFFRNEAELFENYINTHNVVFK